jgi:hypothetical protein
MTDPEVGQLLAHAISKLAPTREAQAAKLGYKSTRQLTRWLTDPPQSIVRLYRVGIIKIQDPPIEAQP